MARKQLIIAGAILRRARSRGVAAWLIAIIISPGDSGQSACINNLRQIVAAKQVWSFANHKAAGDSVSWHDIQPYCGRGSGGQPAHLPARRNLRPRKNRRNSQVQHSGAYAGLKKGVKVTVLKTVFIAGVLLFAALLRMPNFVRSGPGKTTHCVYNLRQIDAAKQAWGINNKKSADDTPTWQDIRPYLSRRNAKTLPKCPEGGTYVLGSLAERPKCSTTGHTLE